MEIRKLFIFSSFFCTILLSAQIRILVNSVPSDTPKEARIYLASSLNGWQAHDENWQLTKNIDGTFSINIPEGKGRFEYKYTLGSWETAETDAKGNTSENRELSFIGKTQDVQDTIHSWAKSSIKKNTASPNVKILSENFFMPQLNTQRRIWIYLPPNYANSGKRYPVIYMPDGQNLFDEATAFLGEWKIDEILDEFARTGGFQAIIVGIDHGGDERLNEYSPWKNEKYGGGKGKYFAEFLTQTLKPYIDQSFRTLPKAENTAIIGSSMGGLIAFYTALHSPNTFGKVGIFSPSFWFAKEELQNDLQKSTSRIQHSKFYFVAGKNESDDMIKDLTLVARMLCKKKVSKKNIRIKIDKDGTHSEAYWSREIPAALRWLFQKQNH